MTPSNCTEPLIDTGHWDHPAGYVRQACETSASRERTWLGHRGVLAPPDGDVVAPTRRTCPTPPGPQTAARSPRQLPQGATFLQFSAVSLTVWMPVAP